MVVDVKPRCCDACVPCTGDFKKVVDLPYSGLVIYVHRKSDDQDDTVFATNEGLIFHNTTNKEINKPKYIDELCQYKTEYSHIKNVIKRVRSLLDEVLVIKGNQVIGVCEHCKKASNTKQCKRCEYIVREFIADKKKRVDDRHQRFKEWLVKVKQLLQSILNAHSVCKHMAYKDTELERILRELRTPLSMRLPIIDFFPNIEADQLMTRSITESKEMLDELLNRIQCEGVQKPVSSNDSLYPSPSGYKETCICKLVKEGHSLEHEISSLSVDRTVSLSETDLKTYSKMLVIDLMQLLQDLKRALILNEFSKADKKLTENLVKNINHVNKHGLLPQSANLLMEQITELRKTLVFDEKAAKKYADLIDDLLAGLKKCKIMTEGFSKHLLKVLVHVCKSTANQLPSDADLIRSKEKSQTQQPKLYATSQQYLDKRSIPSLPKQSKQVLLRDIEDMKAHSDIGAKKLQQTLPKESRQVLLKDVEDMKERSDIGAKKLKQTLPKESRQVLLKDIEDMKAHSDIGAKKLKQTLPKESRQVLLKDIEDMKERGDIGAKKLKQTLPSVSSKDVVSKLKLRPEASKAISKQISTGILKEGDKISLKDSVPRLLKDGTKEEGKALSRQTPSHVLKYGPKEGETALSKDTTSRILKGEPKEGSTLRKYGPSRILKHETKEDEKVASKDVELETFKDGPKVKDRLKEGEKSVTKYTVSRTSKDSSKDGGTPSPKDMVTRTVKDEVKAMPKDTTSRLVKGGPKEETKVLLKDSAPQIAIDRQKELKKVASKASPKTKVSPREAELPKKTVEVNKPRDKGAGKDAGDEVLRARLLELGRALSQGLSQALDKDLVRELTNNLKNAINKETRNVTKGVIEALTDVCSRLTKGIPKNLNKGPVIDLLEDMNEIFTRGLSSDQNKEKLQVKLRELEKALTQTIESDKNKETAPGSKNAAGASSTGTLDPKRKADKIETSEPKGVTKADLAKYAQEAQKKIQIDKERKQAKDLKDKELKSKQTLDKKRPQDKEVRENMQSKDEKPVKEGKQEEKQKLQKSETDQALKEDKAKKERRQSDLLFEKLMSQRKQVKEKEVKDKQNIKEIADKKAKALQLLASLPVIKSVETTSSTDTSESFIYAPPAREASAKYIVIGTSLEPYISLQKELESSTETSMLFKKNITLENIEETAGMTYQKPMSEEKDHKPPEGSGIIKYQLSNRDFIDKGWTQLPTKKIMRRMNIYRMKPANPQYDWFKRHQNNRVMFYETGERLAEIDEEGRGRWYYKNGSVALEYYNAEDMLVGQRYIVYSSGEESEGGRRKPVTVLALFDYLGNGIVYDYNGNVRLKYNQSEGIVVDPKIGAPSRWKWHTLNEPPVLQQVFVNSRLPMRDPYIEELGNSEPQRPIESFIKQAQTDMLQVELDNFVKEKSQKLMQQFKPFRIKMKAAKLNEQFSLKILDQSKISLIFRDGRTSLKLNLGMNLNNHEIIDTDISDATEVSTPYDKFPAKSNSVANLQSILHRIRKSNRPHHTKNFTSREDVGHSRISL